MLTITGLLVTVGGSIVIGTATKGGLISESFLILAQISKKKAPNHDPEHYLLKEKIVRIVI